MTKSVCIIIFDNTFYHFFSSDSDIEIKNPIAHQNLLKPPLVNTKHNIYENISSKPEIDPQVMKKLKYENSTLKERLEQAVHLADMYRKS